MMDLPFVSIRSFLKFELLSTAAVHKEGTRVSMLFQFDCKIPHCLRKRAGHQQYPVSSLAPLQLFEMLQDAQTQSDSTISDYIYRTYRLSSAAVRPCLFGISDGIFLDRNHSSLIRCTQISFHFEKDIVERTIAVELVD